MEALEALQSDERAEAEAMLLQRWPEQTWRLQTVRPLEAEAMWPACP